MAKLGIIDAARSHGSNPVVHGRGPTSGPVVDLGRHIVTAFSIELLRELARIAGLSRITVSSVKRSPGDQARILYNKHVVHGDKSNYKNKEVARMLTTAASERNEGIAGDRIIQEMTKAILAVHGGPSSVSRHCVNDPFLEVLDIAHYGFRNNKRVNYMTDSEAKAFLAACLQRVPLPIKKVGHSAELAIKDKKHEFTDERCFHLEIKVPVIDRLEPNHFPGERTMIA